MLFENLYNRFLKILGDIKIYKYPMFILYDPGSYKIKGEEIREVINTVEPGDILLRGYSNYLDGYLIPGFFSHVGYYLGKVELADKIFVPAQGMHLFKSGQQMVIHAMAEGVFMEDIINFCRCDYMVILRRNKEIENEPAQNISFRSTFEKALSYLGKPYDFQFNFNDFHKLSCTELVYAICNEFIYAYNIKPKTEKFLFIKKQIITPDDFLQTKFIKVWKSKNIPAKYLHKFNIY